MAVKINSTELKELLEIIPAEQNIMLMGKHGIGKSQILEDFFKSKGLKVVALFLGQMSDPGDLIGLLHKNETTGKTEFMPPYWFPTDDKPIVLFLDELNRARPEVLQTIMDLALNRKLAGRALPAGSRIISAVNNGDEYQLTALDPALVSRFNVYEFSPSVDEWISWAESQNLDKRVIDFIRNNPEYLDGEMLRKEDMDLEKTPDRRAWEKAALVLKNYQDVSKSILFKKIIAGIIGVQTTTALFESMKQDQMLSGKSLLEGNFDTFKDTVNKYTTPQLAVLSDSIFKALIQNKDGNGFNLKNVLSYYEFLESENKAEAQSYFANAFTQPENSDGAALIASKIPELADKLIEYISAL